MIFNTIKTAMSNANHANPWQRARNAVSVAVWMRDGGLEIWLSAGTIQSLLFAGNRASLVLPDVAGSSGAGKPALLYVFNGGLHLGSHGIRQGEVPQCFRFLLAIRETVQKEVAEHFRFLRVGVLLVAKEPSESSDRISVFHRRIRNPRDQVVRQVRDVYKRQA